MIKTSALGKHFDGQPAVENLTLEVKEGEIFGFLGPNGAGKTTTIRMLCALVAPSKGKAWVNGFEVGNLLNNAKIRQSIGLLTELPGLYESLSAYDNLLFFAQLNGLDKAEARRRADEVLEWLGLSARATDPAGTFSRGMKQKLAIGRALLHRPKVVFLDEPTASLDAESANSIREAILALKETRRTIFLSTHNMEEANRLCDRIAIFKKTLLELDTPAQLRRKLGADNQLVLLRLPKKYPDLPAALNKLPYVIGASWSKANSDNPFTTLELKVETPQKNNPDLLRFLIGRGVEVIFLEESVISLEDVYLKVVSR